MLFLRITVLEFSALLQHIIALYCVLPDSKQLTNFNTNTYFCCNCHYPNSSWSHHLHVQVIGWEFVHVMKRLNTTASDECRTESHRTKSKRVRVYVTRLHRFGSFDWRPQHVPEGLNMYLKASTCTWRPEHVPEGLNMYLQVSTCTWRPQHVPEGLNLWQKVSTYHNYGQCCVISHYRHSIVSILVVRSNLSIQFYHPTTSLSRNLFVMQGNSWNCTTNYTKWTRCCIGEKWFLLQF
jgi:hypothetical protein